MSGNGASPVVTTRALGVRLVGLLTLTFLCYLPALDAGFIWDDNDWLTENPLVTEPGGLVRIWSGAERLQYYPLLFTAFKLEFQLWGLEPAGYHVVNVALHALNALLVATLALRLAEGTAFGSALDRDRIFWLSGALSATGPPLPRSSKSLHLTGLMRAQDYSPSPAKSTTSPPRPVAGLLARLRRRG